MHRILRLVAVLAVLALVTGSASNAAAPEAANSLSFNRSSQQEIYEAALAYINQLEMDGWDISEDVYEFYFRTERAVHPEFYATRNENSQALDQFTDVCPGGVIYGPEWFNPYRGFGDSYIVQTCGQTYTATNNCNYPACRRGRDVVVTLEIPSFTGLFIRTAGSTFDTYLCLYEDECCPSDNDFLYESNNNFPQLNYGQPLAAGIATCLPPGTYYLILDGASTTSRGSYCVEFEFTEFCL